MLTFPPVLLYVFVSSSLKDTLASYIERKDLDVPPEVEEFPEELLLAHYVEAWKFIVALKQERQRQ